MRSSLARMVFFVFVCVMLPALEASGAVKLPSLFSENMVLQAGTRDPIWGTADPGEGVSVSLEGGQSPTTASATADSAGRWSVELGPLQPGGPFVLTIAGKNTIVIHNVLIGEVWLCSGQSNMTFSVGPQVDGWETGVYHDEQEIASAYYPKVRMFTVAQTVAGKPQSDVAGRWEITSPETVGHFSAVGYFFGLNLFETLHEPIGLIHSSWGGTPAESWTSLATLQSSAGFADILERWRNEDDAYPAAIEQYNDELRSWEDATKQAESAGRPLPSAPHLPRDPRSDSWRPAGLFNAMITPLIPYRIKGAIWYQGESNADRPIQYRKLFPALIGDWRRAWGQGDFPFLFVQLASYQNVWPPWAWPLLREAQLMTLSVPETAMAVTTDIGDASAIHPRNKQEVGRRLALAARALAYHQDVVYSGPIYSSMEVEGNKIRLHFTHLGGGLVAGGGTRGYLEGFEIAGSERKFFGAGARVEGDTVVVESNHVEHPVAVRYAWQNFPISNLYNEAGLAASPFRTDDWPQ